MNSKQKFTIRVVGLTLINIIIIYVFYIQPGFSQNLWTWFYNIFSLLILITEILIYAYTLSQSYAIRKINDTNQLPDANIRWKNIWEDYKRTFLKDCNKTNVPSEIYFNTDNIMTSSHERIPILPILKALPATFTGLGILGTFMGFSAGLQGFNTRTYETMQHSIMLLLSGINTAFNTSIAGLLLSIIFNFLFLQPLLKRLDHDCKLLADRIDNQFYIDELDHIKDFFIFNDNGVKWAPKDVSRSIVEELKKQTRSLANFTTDLSDAMQNLAESLVTTYRQEFNTIISAEIKPVLDKLVESANRLEIEKKESASDAISSIIQNLKITLSDFMESFKDEVTAQTKNEMGELAIQLKNAGESISELPFMISNLKTSFESMTENSINAINNVTLSGANLQNEIIENLRLLSAELNGYIVQFKNSISEIMQQNQHIEEITSKLTEISQTSGNAVKNLTESFYNFKLQNQELLENIKIETDNLRTSAQTLKSTAEGFNGLDETLANTFENIKRGITEYTNVTQEGLSKYLAVYSDSIKNYADRLSSAVEQIPEFLEDLSETIAKIKR